MTEYNPINHAGKIFRPARAIVAVVLAGILVTSCANLHSDDDKEFKTLFDGISLEGWSGEPSLWSVKDGVITGGSEKDIPMSTYLIHESSYSNFEVRFKYRFISEKGNSGMMYRTRVTDPDQYLVSGYQANIVTPDAGEYFGFLYINDADERGILATLGEQATLKKNSEGMNKQVTGVINNKRAVLESVRKFPRWNKATVIAYGNRVVHVINGQVTVDVTDKYPDSPEEGMFALQLHEGPPVQVQFKDIEVRRLTKEPDIYGRFNATRDATIN